MFLDKKGNGTNGDSTEHEASDVSSGTSGRLGLAGADSDVTGRLDSGVASRDNSGDGVALVIGARGDGLGDNGGGNVSVGGVGSDSRVVLSRGNGGSGGNGGNNGELHFKIVVKSG